MNNNVEKLAKDIDKQIVESQRQPIVKLLEKIDEKNY